MLVLLQIADTVFVGKESGHLIQGHKIHSATAASGGISTIFINAPGLDVTTLTYRQRFCRWICSRNRHSYCKRISRKRRWSDSKR